MPQSPDADDAHVRLDGRDITCAPPYRICRMGIGRSFQRTNIFPQLTVFENLQAAYLVHHRRGRNFWTRADALYLDEKGEPWFVDDDAVPPPPDAQRDFRTTAR